ncbi:MAG: hypothetical protein ACF8PN_06845 [Phycisphaerales bacterium]
MGETARQNPKANAEAGAEARTSAPGSASSLEREVDAMLDSVDETLERVARAMGDPFEEIDDEAPGEDDGSGEAAAATDEAPESAEPVDLAEASAEVEVSPVDDLELEDSEPPVEEELTPDHPSSDESEEDLEAIDSMLADAAAHMLDDESEAQSLSEVERAEVFDDESDPAPASSSAVGAAEEDSGPVREPAPMDSDESPEDTEDEDPEKIDPELKAELESHLNEVASEDEGSDDEDAPVAEEPRKRPEKAPITPAAATTNRSIDPPGIKDTDAEAELDAPHGAEADAESTIEDEPSTVVAAQSNSIAIADDEPSIRDDLRGVAQTLSRWAAYLPARDRIASAAIATLARINRPWSRFSDDTKLMILMFAGGTAVVAAVAWTLVLFRIL